MTYRMMDCEYWADPFIEKLDPMTKYFYLYLITRCPNLIGIFEVTEKKIVFETGLDKENIKIYEENLKDRVFKVNDFYFISRVLKHLPSKSIKVFRAVEKQYSSYCGNEILKFVDNYIKQAKLSYLFFLLKNSENVIEDKKEESQQLICGETEEVIKVAEKLLKKIVFVCPTRKDLTSEINYFSNLKNFSDQINFIINSGFDLKSISDVIDWTFQDDFWKNQITSGLELRLKFEKLFTLSQRPENKINKNDKITEDAKKYLGRNFNGN